MWGEMCECVWRMRVHNVCVDSEGVWCEVQAGGCVSEGGGRMGE